MNFIEHLQENKININDQKFSLLYQLAYLLDHKVYQKINSSDKEKIEDHFSKLCLSENINLPSKLEYKKNDNLKELEINYDTNEVLEVTKRKLKNRVSILIIDDSVNAILKTYKNVIGIENVSVKIMYVEKFEENISINQVYEKLANMALNEKPQIILMDQELGKLIKNKKRFKGDELVKIIKEKNDEIVFVGNTTGDGIVLQMAGCFDNFAKGADDFGLRMAFSKF